MSKKVLDIAKSQVGTHEVPDGSNSGPKVREYQKATWLSGTGWPWCAAFVCWCQEQAGQKLIEPSAGAWDLVNRATRNGQGRQVPLAGARPGDLVAFNIGSGHIGIYMDHDGNTVTTCDGNASNQVKVCTRPIHSIYKVVHITSQVIHPPRPPKPPLYQLVTSEDGHRQVVASAPTLQALIAKLQRLRRRGHVR